MAKGERKVQNNESDDDSDSDDEYDAPSYDELVKLLNKYSKVIRRTRNKNDELLLSRSSKLLTKSLEINMINLRRSMMSSTLGTTS
jgi:hypothetical protein